MTGREFTWDGLTLQVPQAWEPARLGLGYALFEDPSGPRLSLRWQVLARGRSPERLLRRLARRSVLKPGANPGPAVAAMLKALPGERGGLACSDASGRGGDSVLFTIASGREPGRQEPGGEARPGLVVLAAPHARPDETAAPWSEAAASVAPAHPGAFSLYEVSGKAPDGFRLASFAMRLGHYRLLYACRAASLEYHRFAPSEVILRGSTLEDWAGEVFARSEGRKRIFEPGYFDGFPSALHANEPRGGAGGLMRRLAARLFEQARLARCLAWKPDGARILAVMARHCGDLPPGLFEQACREFQVRPCNSRAG